MQDIFIEAFEGMAETVYLNICFCLWSILVNWFLELLKKWWLIMFNYHHMIRCAINWVKINTYTCSYCTTFAIKSTITNIILWLLCNIKKFNFKTYLLQSWPIFMTWSHYSHYITVCNCITSVTMMMVTRTRSQVTGVIRLVSCSGVEVGWVRLSWEWILVWEGMRIWVDQSK